jgi:vancomycin permeability regulator SanA
MKITFQNKSILISLSLLELANYFILTFLKYYLNNISLSEYRIDYIGNLLNTIFSLVLISGVIVLGFRKIQLEKPRLRFLISLQIISLCCLLSLYFFSDILKLGSSGYLFSFPAKKVYIGLLFSTSLFVQLYSLIYVWGIILGFEKYFEVRTLLRTLSAVFILVLFTLFIVWDVNSFTDELNPSEKYEYALIPGAAVWKKEKPSPIFEGRIRKGLELYRKGTIGKIILTGGNAPGELSESEVAYRFLTNLGVNFKNLIVERTTSTTAEQIKYLKTNEILSNTKARFVVISDDFHLTRILQICKFFRVEAIGVASKHRLTLEKTIFYRTRESIALLLFWFFAI